MLTQEYLVERIAYHGRKVQEHVLACDRCEKQNLGGKHLEAAATHASIYTALCAILAKK